jgi:hypothetical protein
MARWTFRNYEQKPYIFARVRCFDSTNIANSNLKYNKKQKECKNYRCWNGWICSHSIKTTQLLNIKSTNLTKSEKTVLNIISEINNNENVKQRVRYNL